VVERGLETITVALVTSKRGDMGFNDQAWEGCQMAVREFGIKLLDAQATDMAEADAGYSELLRRWRR